MGECTGSTDVTSFVDDITSLRRFLLFGNELGRCTIEDAKLKVDNVKCIMRLIEADRGDEVVNQIALFSCDGRVLRQKYLVFALAVCVRLTDKNPQNLNHLKTKQAALSALPDVFRIPTDLFQFVQYCKELSKSDGGKGWGKAFKRAICQWYTCKEPMKLAHLVTKYVQRCGWKHRDLLRMCHIKAEDEGLKLVIQYVTRGLKATKETFEKENKSDTNQTLLQYFEAVDTLKKSHDEQEAAGLIRKHKLVREQIPTWLYNKKEVWAALAEDMPMKATLKNLGKMASLGILDDDCSQSEIVIQRLNDTKALSDARIHPFQILLALEAYKKEKSEHKHKLSWKTNPGVITALNNAFTACFQNIPATNKRILLAIDASKSMSIGDLCGAKQVSPLLAAAAMALMTSRVEANYDVITFSKDVRHLTLSRDTNLSDVMQELKDLPASQAELTRPVTWALANQKPYDAIVLYTDSALHEGAEKPAEVIKRYRAQMNIPDAKFIVCALGKPNFEAIADPTDRHMLDVAGMDSQTPALIHAFINSQI